MNLLVVSSNYPSPETPQMGTFVYKLIQRFAAKDNVNVTVISPQKYALRSAENQNYGSEQAVVYRPKFLSVSNKQIGPLNTYHITQCFQAKAVKKAVEKAPIKPQVIYCHFIVSALTYFRAVPHSKLPVFVAVGEYHQIDVIRRHYTMDYYQKCLERVRGFIAVSPMVKDKLLSIGVSESKIIVAPNGVDGELFKPRDKTRLRESYGLPVDKKIVLFVGRLLENKGPLRVQQALESLAEDVVAIFVGQGPQQVSHPKIVFSGVVEHRKVADYMSLSDVFVLPTLHEGSSNVIVEAMASGLPIVSSDLPEIKVQCDERFSILVDPNNVDEIATALNKVLEDDILRSKMSENALEASRQFDLNQRARNILDFMRDNV